MTRECPPCNGTGFVAGDPEPGPNGSMGITKEPCPRCKGKGELPGRDGAPKPF